METPNGYLRLEKEELVEKVDGGREVPVDEGLFNVLGHIKQYGAWEEELRQLVEKSPSNFFRYQESVLTIGTSCSLIRIDESGASVFREKEETEYVSDIHYARSSAAGILKKAIGLEKKLCRKAIEVNDLKAEGLVADLGRDVALYG